MHQLYFVRIKDSDSGSARSRAIETLTSEGFFSQGVWSCGKGDWGVVGGRWSGTFQEMNLKLSFSDKVAEVTPSHNSIGYSSDEIRDNQEQFQSLWESLGGTDINPLNRDTYKREGYDDDAILLTPSLLKELKKEYSDIEVFDADEYEETTVKSIKKDTLAENDYLVIIDYHC